MLGVWYKSVNLWYKSGPPGCVVQIRPTWIFSEEVSLFGM